MGGTNSKRIKKAALGKTRVLKFRRKRLTPTDLQALCQALSCETNRLVSMEFNATGIGLKGLAKVAEAIQHPNCRLTRLCIFNEHVGAVGARILAKLITLPKKPLMSLILENNVLTSEGATILAEALQDPNNRLHVLYLLNNHIGPEGIVAICNALRHENNRVVELSLTGNYLGVEGLAEIGSALKHPNNKIEYLRLGRNRIDNRGACILAKAMIHENARVRSLDLENNSVSDTRDLTRAMKLSKLQWVDLSFNNDNPYDQTRMYCDIRVVFFEKRRYWMSILALCSARGAPSVLKRFYEDCAQLQLEEEARKQNDVGGLIRRAAHTPVALAVRDATRIRPAIKRSNICYLCLLPKDLIKMIAAMVYPWPRTEKMLIGFVY